MSWLVRNSDREMGLCPNCGSSIFRDREGFTCLDAGHLWEWRDGALASPVVIDLDQEAKWHLRGVGQRVDTIIHGNRLSRRLEERSQRSAESIPAVALQLAPDAPLAYAVHPTVRQ